MENDVSLKQMIEYDIAYRIGEPKIDNHEWDRLVREMNYHEQLYDTNLMKSDNGRQLVPMNSPMVSLKKLYDVDKLLKWLEKVKYDQFVIEPKLDGNALNVSYTVLPDGTAVRNYIGSPGDGLCSLLTHPHALDDVELIGIPESLSADTVKKFADNDAVINGTIEIRGEGIIDQDKFVHDNPGFDYNGTWRQMVSAMMCRSSGLSWDTVNKGLLNDYNDMMKRSGLRFAMKKAEMDANAVTYDSNLNSWMYGNEPLMNILPKLVEFGSKVKCLHEHMYMVTYSCSTKYGNKDCPFLNEVPELVTFEQGGFDNDNQCLTKIEFTVADMDKVRSYIAKFFGRDQSDASLRHAGKFQCDGLVFKQFDAPDEGVFDTRSGNGLAHDPKNMMALKLMPEPIDATILDIWSNVTDKGNVTMHAHIKPVMYMGSTIENLNLFTPNWLESRKGWIYPGATVQITFSGDLIPVIVEKNEKDKKEE